MRPLLAISMLLLTAAPAAAQDIGLGKATSATVELTSSRPGSVSDVALRVTGTPPPAGVKLAPAIRQVVELPRGSKVRSLPQCPEAVAAQFACPASTRVGQGLAVGTAAGNEIRLDLGIYAVPGALLFSAERDGVPLKQSFRAAISGRRLVFTVPTLDGQLVPKLFTATLKKLVRTPASCPKNGRWRSAISFQALTAPAGGALVGPAQSLASTSWCR